MPRTLPKHRAREYETVFIVNPETTADAMDQLATKLTDVIVRLKGKVLRAENWGKRRLAYPVKKHVKGTYVYIRYLGYSGMVHEIERNMRMMEPVLKYITVKLEEDVDPDARPVREEDISFIPMYDEEPETRDAHLGRHTGRDLEGSDSEGEVSAWEDEDDLEEHGLDEESAPPEEIPDEEELAEVEMPAVKAEPERPPTAAAEEPAPEAEPAEPEKPVAAVEPVQIQKPIMVGDPQEKTEPAQVKEPGDVEGKQVPDTDEPEE